ncbi:MAG: phage portal protein, partial [Planctomycetota bacterium]
MKMFNWLKRKKNLPLKRKSFLPLGGFVEHLTTYGHTDLAAMAAVELFNVTAPLGSAVDIISSEFASLIPQVTNEEKEVISNHPVLELLDNPNSDSSRSEFLYRLCAFFLITGNSYLTATGDIRREPLELFSIYPQTVQPEADSFDGLTLLFRVQHQSGASIYAREEIGKRFRYYYHDEAELWQIKAFNPNNGNLVGQSPVSGILAEIDQYNAASVHNRSLLKRGGRPSGILMASTGKDASGNAAEPLTDDQYRRLREQANRYLTGAENAGNVFIAEGANIDYKDMITSNRDMDFIKGRKDVRSVIYTQYRIPLPLVSSDHQTLANMETATDHLYDGAVLPVADRLFSELSLFLMTRYKRSDNLVLGYDEAAI